MRKIAMAIDPPLKPAFGSRQWRKAQLRSDRFQNFASAFLHKMMRFTHYMQRDTNVDKDQWPAFEPYTPAIIAMWHGQHFMVPFMWPANQPVDALISKNADAEINARILQRMGINTIRGSGGRDHRQNVDRGGAKALLELRRSLASGRNVAMIADISHKAPRQAGEGIVTLARITGRPIVPVAYATSNGFVFKKSWDKATLNLPFGRRAFVIGNPVYVAETDDLPAKQAEVTGELNRATQKAYANVGRVVAGHS